LPSLFRKQSPAKSIGTITLETALVWLDKYPLRCNIVIGPGSIPWEIGNAFSAMFKRNRLSLEEAKRGLEIFKSIPLRYTEPDFINSVSISQQTNMYAYDAYFLDCALRQKAPILTLDSKLKETAKKLKIKTLEA